MNRREAPRGCHALLRVEALDCLEKLHRSSNGDGGRRPEWQVRDKIALAREWCDDEAVALWSRVLWRLYVRARYTLRQRPRCLVLQDAPEPPKHVLRSRPDDPVDAPIPEDS
jgi:hypothetical protein